MLTWFLFRQNYKIHTIVNSLSLDPPYLWSELVMLLTQGPASLYPPLASPVSVCPLVTRGPSQLSSLLLSNYIHSNDLLLLFIKHNVTQTPTLKLFIYFICELHIGHIGQFI